MLYWMLKEIIEQVFTVEGDDVFFLKWSQRNLHKEVIDILDSPRLNESVTMKLVLDIYC